VSDEDLKRLKEAPKLAEAGLKQVGVFQKAVSETAKEATKEMDEALRQQARQGKAFTKQVGVAASTVARVSLAIDKNTADSIKKATQPIMEASMNEVFKLQTEKLVEMVRQRRDAERFITNVSPGVVGV
jgi:hypothetical protein